MDCAEFEERLFERLDRLLEPADEDQMKSHAARCGRCRELEALVSDEPALPQAEAPAGLLSSILAHTSGDVCERARLRVSELLDDAAGKVDPMLEAHLESCSSCNRLARVIEGLRHDLPELGTLQPDAGFVAAVVEATAALRGPGARAVAAGGRAGSSWRRYRRRQPATVPGSLHWGTRLAAYWIRLVRRPRLALEGAFIGTAVMVLALGLPPASVDELPLRVIDEVRQERIEVEHAVSTRLQILADAGRDTWAASANRVVGFIETSPGRSALSAVRDTLRSWGDGARSIATSAWSRDFSAVYNTIRDWWIDEPSPAGSREDEPSMRST